MLLGIGRLLSRGSTSAAAIISAAASLAAGEAQALAIDFTDDLFLGTTGQYGSAYILDTTTPANNYDSIPYGKLTYTSPSLKMCRQADGLLKFGPHNLLLRSDALGTAPWSLSDVTYSVETATEGASGTATLSQSVTAIANAGYRVRLKLKRGNTDWVRILHDDTAGNGARVWVNLSTGVLGTQTIAGTATLGAVTISTADPNGFYLVSIDCTYASTTKRVAINSATADNSGTRVNNATFLVKNAQIARAPCVDTYLATTTTVAYELPYEWDASGNPLGLLVEEARTNLCLYSDDLTNAAWNKTSATAAKTATGPDGVANSASTLTATAANGAVLQRFTSTSAIRSGSVYLKRRTGTGAVSAAIGETTGSNLLTDGTFTSGVADWLPVGSGTITHTGSAGLITAGAATGQGAHATFTTTPGKLYRCQITITLGTATVVDASIANTAALSTSLGLSYSFVNSSTTYIAYAYATTTTLALVINPRGVGLTVTVDDATCFEVTESTIDLSSGNWVRATIENKTLTNPCLAIKLATSGDAVDVALGQMETGAFVTSPTPTIAASVTRAADNITQLTSTFPWNASNSSIYVKFRPLDVSAERIALSLNNGTANEVILIGSTSVGAGFIQLIDGGANQLAPLTSGTVTTTAFDRLAASIAANDVALVSDGGAEVTDTSVTLPTVTTLRFGSRLASATPLNGHLQQVLILPRTSTEAQLQGYGA